MNRDAQRYFAEGLWRANSAIHIGGEDNSLDSPADMNLLRDSAGNFLIPGASVAGAARSYVARTLLPRAKFDREIPAEPIELRALFGGGDKAATNDFASILTVRDAMLEGGAQVVVRDGVRIDERYGIAAEGAKYNLQALPAGSSFRLRFDLALLETLPHGLPAEEVLRLFHLALGGFKSGAISLGAKTRRGFGAGAVHNWIVRRLDMSTLEHMKAWLKRDFSDIRPLDEKLIPAEQPPIPEGNSTFELSARLRLKTSLLIRAAADASSDAKAPDSVHLTEMGKQILSGTSMAGAFRARCIRIANLMHAQEMIEPLFGKVDEQHSKENRASRIRFSESEVGPGDIQVQGRVSIDRFTGAAKDSALFEEAALWPNEHADSHVSVRLIVENPVEREIGLVALAFKDLWLGDLPVGGGVGAGRGVLTGWSADAYWKRSGQADSYVSWKGDGEAGCICLIKGDLAFLNNAVAALNAGSGK